MIKVILHLLASEHIVQFWKALFLASNPGLFQPPFFSFTSSYMVRFTRVVEG